MRVKLRFWGVARNPLRRSCVSKARHAGKVMFFVCLEGYARQWLTFKVFVAQNAGKVFQFFERLVENTWFWRFHSQFLQMSRVKRSFWKLSWSLFANVSRAALVLEVYILTFCECLVWNARFGSLHSHFLRMSRVKRSFWKPTFSLFANVSCETRILKDLHICASTSSHLPHLHIYIHLHIFTSAHLHLCSSSHLRTYISAYLHICISTSSYLHFCASTSSGHLHHLLIQAVLLQENEENPVTIASMAFNHLWDSHYVKIVQVLVRKLGLSAIYHVPRDNDPMDDCAFSTSGPRLNWQDVRKIAQTRWTYLDDNHLWATYLVHKSWRLEDSLPKFNQLFLVHEAVSTPVRQAVTVLIHHTYQESDHFVRSDTKAIRIHEMVHEELILREAGLLQECREELRECRTSCNGRRLSR